MNFILPLAAIIAVVVAFLLLVKRIAGQPAEYTINTDDLRHYPANHPEMHGAEVAAAVNQSFSGHGHPVEGVVMAYDDDGEDAQAYYRYLERMGQKNGNNVTVKRVRRR